MAYQASIITVTVYWAVRCYWAITVCSLKFRVPQIFKVSVSEKYENNILLLQISIQHDKCTSDSVGGERTQVATEAVTMATD